MTKRIVSLSLGSSSRDYAFRTHLFDEEIEVERLGTDGDVERARALISESDGEVDAIGLADMAVYYRVGQHSFVQRQALALARTARTTPVVDGIHVRNTLERWAIGQIARQQPGIWSQKRILILSGIRDYGVAQVLSGYSSQIRFADPVLRHNLPFMLRSFRQLERYATVVLPALCRAPDNRRPANDDQLGGIARGSEYLKQADVIVGEMAALRRLGSDGLRGKTLVTRDLSDTDIEELRQRGLETLITFTPRLGEEQPFVGANVLEAMFACFLDRPVSDATDDDFLNLVDRSGLEPAITVLNEPRDVARFAFVIHPLTVNHVFNHPQLKHLRFLPHRLIEWTMAQIRPLYVSRITGVRSAATGKEVEGTLITLGATPRELMRHKPGFTYRRLIVASRMAQQNGAKIMGLGAFTKVVGDAGMTVAYKSDIAITSGNSLTVAATLEAAKQAVLKMGGPVDRGRAVVIGATGSIGSVCSRLLAQAIQDVVLVAPRPEKLIPLKKMIEVETPGTRVVIATDARPYLGEADLVVTTTTAIGEKVIDVLALKPGCVVCDVARPPDVHEEDARLRPDVLVVESGEILLPGEPDFGFNIGLPPGVAYACLAEAALLAMEGRFENFTLGRNIEMDKVKEIYRLFKKHGLQLEGLRSFGRYVSDEEIARKRELADEFRAHPDRLAAAVERAREAGGSGPQAAGATRRNAVWLAAGASAAAGGLVWLLSRRKERDR